MAECACVCLENHACLFEPHQFFVDRLRVGGSHTRTQQKIQSTSGQSTLLPRCACAAVRKESRRLSASIGVGRCTCEMVTGTKKNAAASIPLLISRVFYFLARSKKPCALASMYISPSLSGLLNNGATHTHTVTQPLMSSCICSLPPARLH